MTDQTKKTTVNAPSEPLAGPSNEPAPASSNDTKNSTASMWKKAMKWNNNPFEGYRIGNITILKLQNIQYGHWGYHVTFECRTRNISSRFVFVFSEYLFLQWMDFDGILRTLVWVKNYKRAKRFVIFRWCSIKIYRCLALAVA